MRGSELPAEIWLVIAASEFRFEELWSEENTMRQRLSAGAQDVWQGVRLFNFGVQFIIFLRGFGAFRCFASSSACPQLSCTPAGGASGVGRREVAGVSILPVECGP